MLRNSQTVVGDAQDGVVLGGLPQGLSRRGFLGLGGTVAGVTLLGACGSGGGNASSGTDLTYWTMLDPKGEDPRGPAERRILDLFQKQSDYSVREVIVPWQDIDKNLITAVQAGKPPQVSRVNNYNFKQHVEAGSLLSLQEMADEDLSVAELNDFIVKLEGEDGIQAFLIENVANALYLRKDWLAGAGVEAPKTWDEFVAVGQALQQFKPGASGFLTFGSTAESGQVWCLFEPMIRGRGGEIIDENGMAAFNQQAGVETYEFLRSLVYEHKIMPKAAATTAYSEQIDAFISGQTGMIIEGSHRYGAIVAGVGEENIEVVQIPGPTSDKTSPCGITGWAIGIPRGSSNVKGAWEVIKYRTDPKQQAVWGADAFGLPTRSSTLDQPFFKTEKAAILRWWLEYEQTNGMLTTAPATYTQLTEAMTEALQEVLLHEDSDVQGVLDDAAERFNATVA
jgi:multiple sugar transport system substrate-binding protein